MVPIKVASLSRYASALVVVLSTFVQVAGFGTEHLSAHPGLRHTLSIQPKGSTTSVGVMAEIGNVLSRVRGSLIETFSTKQEDMLSQGSSAGAPSALAAYCSGNDKEMKVGSRTECNWRGMGYFRGKIVKMHEDLHKVDIRYDDGFVERFADERKCRLLESQPDGFEPAKADPACLIEKEVTALKKKLQKASTDMALWTSAARSEATMTEESRKARKERVSQARMKEAKVGLGGVQPHNSTNGLEGQVMDAVTGSAGAPAAVVLEPVVSSGPVAEAAGAPGVAVEKHAPLPMQKLSSAEEVELERLKRELAKLDWKARRLIGVVGENEEELDDILDEDLADSVNLPDPQQLKDVRKRIVWRRDEILRLVEKKDIQEEHLIALGKEPVSLLDIKNETDQITQAVSRLKAKRDAIEKKSGVDDELQESINQVVEAEAGLSTKVDKLVEIVMDDEAQRGEDELHDGDDDSEAASEAAREADLRVLEAAEDVEVQLFSAYHNAEHLDAGVIVHGQKWWRFRYEHSFVESVLMIMIIILILIWRSIYLRLKFWIFAKSEAIEPVKHLGKGTMYVHWLDSFSGQMTVCTFVFITVWFMWYLHVYDLFHYLFGFLCFNLVTGTAGFHTPSSAIQYRYLAIDICVNLFIAQILFFVIVFSIVYATSRKMADWHFFDDLPKEDGTTPGRATTPGKQAAGAWSSTMRKGTFLGVVANVALPANDVAAWQGMKEYFIAQVSADAGVMTAIGFQQGEKLKPERFQFSKYMRESVRSTCNNLFRFGLDVWIGVLITFAIFAILHRLLLVGYLRIAIFFLIFLCVLVGMMIYWVWLLVDNIEKVTVSVDLTPRSRFDKYFAASKTHMKVPTEEILVTMINYTLFLLCWFCARMVIQSWMWQFHFGGVLILTIIAVAVACIFCCAVAKMFPNFAAAMALPPFLGPNDIERLKWCYQKASAR